MWERMVVSYQTIRSGVWKDYKRDSDNNHYSPDSDWLEWIKTLGDLHGENGDYYIQFDSEYIRFSVKPIKSGYIVKIPEVVIKERPAFGKIFRQVFRKASYCKGCRVCEANCRNGCISFVNGKVRINNCIQCHECHAIDSGCLLFHSLRHPQGGGKSMKSLNSFADHAPKPEWLRSFLNWRMRSFRNILWDQWCLICLDVSSRMLP